jgi:hypothetical protein
MAVTSSAMAQSITIGSDTILTGGTASIQVSYASEGDTTILGVTAVVDYDETNFTFAGCTQGTAPTGVTLSCSDDGAAVTVGALSLGASLPDIDPIATIEFTYSGAATPPPDVVSALTFGAGTVCSDAGANAVNCAQNPGQITVTDVIPFSLTVNPTSVDFGDVEQNSDPAAQTVTITADAGNNADLTGLTIGTATGSFSATNVDCGTTLAPGASCQVSVDVTDTSVLGALAGAFDVTTTETGTTTVNLAANITEVVILPDIDVSPLTLTFDPAAPTAQTVTISNVAMAGAQDLNVTGITPTGNFEIVAGGDCAATPFTLAPGASCTVSVAPTATAMENDTGTLVVDSDDADEPSVTVALSLTTAIPIAIPTLSQWSMILVGSLLALLAMGGLRRKEG